MKRFLFFLVFEFSLQSAFSADQFYVIMKDGSVESYSTDDLDSISFDAPKVENIMSVNDLAERIVSLEKEIEEFKANCGVGKADTGNIDGYDFVDLGLPSGLKWATKNIGADEVSDWGNYYSWGEIAPSYDYSEENCKTYETKFSELRKNGDIDALGNLTAKKDVASKNWSENWRMPTFAEYEELINNCTWEWVSLEGVNGYKIGSKKEGNSNSIFMPAAGCVGYLSGMENSLGMYWTSTFHDYNSYSAYCLSFNRGGTNLENYLRYYGCTVRPVSDK